MACIGVGVFVYARESNKPPVRYRGVANVEIAPAAKKVAKQSSSSRKTTTTAAPVVDDGARRLAVSTTTKEAALRGAHLAETNRTVGFSAKIVSNGQFIALTVTTRDAATANAVAASWARAFVIARQQATTQAMLARRAAIFHQVTLIHNELRRVDAKLAKLMPAIYGGILRYDQPFGQNSSGRKGATNVSLPPVPEDAGVYALNLALERPTLLSDIASLASQTAQLNRNSVTPDSFAKLANQVGARRIVKVRSVTLPAGAGLVGGLAIGLGTAIVLDRRDRRIRDPRTAAAAFAAPVLSLVPSSSDSDYAILAEPMSDLAEAYRSLAATSIATDRLPKAIMVSTPHGDAHEEVAANYAAALSRFGLRVALIATTPDQAWYAERFGSAEHRLLTEHRDEDDDEDEDEDSGADDTAVVAEQPKPGPPASSHGDIATFPELLVAAHEGTLNGHLRNRLSTDERAPNLMVVPPSDEAPAHMPIDGLPPLLAALTEAGIDITVVSGPALLEDADATIVAWATRCVLWAIVEGEITSTEARAAAARLELAGVVPFGVVMVGNRLRGL